jgi:lipoyl(octanoyl) transferase
LDSFRLLDTAPSPGAWNMAADEVLAASVAAGGPPVLRLYRWDPPCLSLGRNQPARGAYDLDRLNDRGIHVVRRPTGGRAVLHDRELTYSVLVPDRALGGPRALNAAVHRTLLAAVRDLGVPACVQPPREERASAPSLDPCFSAAAEGEITVGGRKLVGSAQRRQGGVLLQHGSLLLESDQSLIRELVAIEANGAAVPVSPPITLREVLGTLPSWERMVEAIAGSWTAETGSHVSPSRLTEEELGAVEREQARFLDPAWTWRR